MECVVDQLMNGSMFIYVLFLNKLPVLVICLEA